MYCLLVVSVVTTYNQLKFRRAVIVTFNMQHAEPREEKIGEDPNDAQKLAIALDTALVQALLATDQSATALQLLKGTNFCDVAACEDEMLAGGHYLELLELYKSRKKHRQALFLLNRLAEHPETFAVPPTHPEQFDSRAIVNYLQVHF